MSLWSCVSLLFVDILLSKLDIICSVLPRFSWCPMALHLSFLPSLFMQTPGSGELHQLLCQYCTFAEDGHFYANITVDSSTWHSQVERSPPFTSVEIDHIRAFVAQQVDEDLVLYLGEGYFDRCPRQVARVVVYWSLTQAHFIIGILLT